MTSKDKQKKDEKQKKICDLDGYVTNISVTYLQAKKDLDKAIQSLKDANQKIQEFYFKDGDGES